MAKFIFTFLLRRLLVAVVVAISKAPPDVADRQMSPTADLNFDEEKDFFFISPNFRLTF